MKKIVSDGSEIKNIYVNKKEALKLFSDKDETYKIEIIKESKQETIFKFIAKKIQIFLIYVMDLICLV